ncbi:hypothetical protein [Actinocatenispora rupis]|uniref:4,5-dihydroxyphthalate decarboxylase n=1 Tax=Actinocatenispora rupis TaxID=519421 RepID=A0A8J3NEF9_9ACTN|nr:hypothetical protein [Actinocatenispora rupis]GID12539.1 hypothetical protein Aru02nite_34280 [Actinocatenispora rupis]
MSTTDTPVRLGARPWAHLVPLTLREVGTPGLELTVERRPVTPDLLAEPTLDAAETSFSRYVRARAAGDDRIVAVPAFVMRSFRHRCLLVRRDSPRTEVTQLGGTRIGVTGWPDSGNTWTRAILRRAGVDLGGIDWTVGPLTADAAGGDRLGGVTPPGNVRLAGPGESLVGGLLDGSLDAIMTPFMPPGFHTADSPLRQLLVDYPAAEAAYLREVGFIPGIHLVGVRRELVERRPTVLAELCRALAASRDAWWATQRKLADPTPWALHDIDRTERLAGPDWMPYGLVANGPMIAAFCAELLAQGLVDGPVDVAGLFPEYAKVAEEEN